MTMDLAEHATLTLQGVSIPTFLYGTAWKEDQTAALTAAALAAGFRGIDTANQRKHYHEAGAGEAVRAWLAAGNPRSALFLQTKFTHRAGQDHRLPYDEDQPVTVQVGQSLRSSLQHLGVDAVDSLLLHGPQERDGLSTSDWDFWVEGERLHDAGMVRLLGASNITADQLRQLIDRARIPPALVQNRCYARHGWDAEVRAICRAHGIVYQGFSLLTANRKTWGHRAVADIARRLSATPAQVLFRFALSEGILPITGTTDPRHMTDDLASRALSLTAEDVEVIASIER
jgi:diketogulonate reductase-like aldo/keto reductase